jgi:hypothetical protein
MPMVGRRGQDGAAVGEQLTQVVERNDAVAQQAPPLLEMAGYHARGHVIGHHRVGAPGLVVAHVPLPGSRPAARR